MADTPISGLPAASAIADADLYAGVQGGVTVKFTHQQMADFLASELASSLAGPGDKGDIVIDTDGVWHLFLTPGDYGDIVVDTDGVWTIDPALLAVLAAKSQTDEAVGGWIRTVADETIMFAVKMPHGGTITEATTKAISGTCTATFKINTTALGGTANSVSSSEQSQAHASANVFAAADDLQVTLSANAACLGMTFTLKYTRVLA